MRFSVWDVDRISKLRKVSWIEKPVDHDLSYITGSQARRRSLSPIQRRILGNSIETDQDLVNHPDVTGNMHAPFGTEQTPPLKVKIIGGRYVTVLERPPVSPRADVEPLTRSVGKPNVQLDMRKWSDKFHQIVTPRDGQPMAKQELNKSPPLPPIPHQSMHDPYAQTHTGVPQSFEPPISMKEFAHTLPPAGVNSSRSQHLPLPPIASAEAEGDLASSVFDLYDVLPKDKYLPSYPVLIDAAHYVALLSELERELGHLNPNMWQQIYIELTTFDRRLSGEIKFNDLGLVLVRNGVFLQPQLLRLLGALFVATTDGTGTRVNYEKVVSFLSACMKYFTEKQQRNLIIGGATLPLPPFELLPEPSTTTVVSQSAQTNTYDSPIAPPNNGGTVPGHGVPVWDLLEKDYDQMPHPQRNLPPPGDPRFHSDMAAAREEIEARFREKFYEQEEQTQRDLEDLASLKSQDDAEFSRFRQLAVEQIVHAGRPLDSEALRLHFQRADRNMRGTLSVGQIVDLCQIARVPLEAGLIADVVRKLCTHRGGGQYDWQEFQAFIDRLKPQQTGLNVGLHNYARVLAQPEPLPSWPHAEPGTMPRLAQPENRDQEPSKYYASPMENMPQLPAGAPPNGQPEQRLQLDNLRRALEQENPQHITVPDLAAPQNRTGVSALLEHFQLTPRSKNSKWMERFMQLAAAVYENVDAQGFSKANMARHVAKKQADTLRLMIADIDIDDALRFSRTIDGRIDTQLFLKRLCRNKLSV